MTDWTRAHRGVKIIKNRTQDLDKALAGRQDIYENELSLTVAGFKDWKALLASFSGGLSDALLKLPKSKQLARDASDVRDLVRQYLDNCTKYHLSADREESGTEITSPEGFYSFDAWPLRTTLQKLEVELIKLKDPMAPKEEVVKSLITLIEVGKKWSPIKSMIGKALQGRFDDRIKAGRPLLVAIKPLISSVAALDSDKLGKKVSDLEGAKSEDTKKIKAEIAKLVDAYAEVIKSTKAFGATHKQGDIPGLAQEIALGLTILKEELSLK